MARVITTSFLVMLLFLRCIAQTCCNCVTPTNSSGCIADPTCEYYVCNNDGYCCTNKWDYTCATAASDMCTMGSGPPTPPTAPTSSTTTGPPTVTPTTTIAPTADISLWDNQWIKPSNPTLPNRVNNGAIGYSFKNNTIQFISQQMMSLDLYTNTFEISDNYMLKLYAYNTGEGQYYTQVGEYIYMLVGDTPDAPAVLWRHNVETLNYQSIYPQNDPNSVSGSACIASKSYEDGNNYLFILGRGFNQGATPPLSNMVQILNLTDNTWLPGVPFMIVKRSNFACVTNDYSLYAIGGYTSCGQTCAGPIDSVEVLDIYNLKYDTLSKQTWVELSDTLSVPMDSFRAVSYRTVIMCIGGYTYNGDVRQPVTDINVIDTTSNAITVSGNLNVGSNELSGAPIIIVDGTLYVFLRTQQFVYINLLTIPTNAPTLRPTPATTYPSRHPTLPPSENPTKNPTTPFPTTTPTKYPTKIPTINPTMNPSDIPTYSPSNAPSDAPTVSPTRFPTDSSGYGSHIDVIYGLQYFTNDILKQIVDNTKGVMNDIERIIEMGYVNEKTVIIGYKDFYVQILKLDKWNIGTIDPSNLLTIDISDDTLIELTAKIECDQNECYHLVTQYDELSFTSFVSEELNNYFAGPTGNRLLLQQSLEFSVIEMQYETTDAILTSQDDNVLSNYIFYGLLCVTFVIIIIGFIACCYNDGICFEFPTIRQLGCATVDDGKYMAVIVFAAAFFDFASDINLTTEIWTQNDNIFDEPLLLISGIGSTLFILIPYFANICIATNIKQRIVNNESAKSWFQYYSKTFTLLVALTGGCYPAIKLVSSNIFGLTIMSSGLTQYELIKLSKIRVYYNVVLENIPQLTFQLLYVYSIDGISEAVIFAFIASILSIISTTVSYFIDRDALDTKVIEYYLITECNHRFVSTPTCNEADIDGYATPSVLSVQSKSISSDRYITKKERLSININKGRRKLLGVSMAELFGIPRKNIQIGTSMLTKHGMITHVVHFIYDADLKAMNKEIDKTNSETVTTKYFVNELYSSLKEEVNKVIRKHFELNDNFYVKLSFSLSQKERAGSLFHTGSDNDIEDKIFQFDEGQINDTNNTTVEMTVPIVENNNDSNDCNNED